MVGWWNCEVRIWRVKSQPDGAEKPKVVARLALQGDENITSVAISRDGHLLSVATAKEVKLFQFTKSKASPGSGLRIRKLEAPSMAGARLVRFSADAKWLAVITAANEIQLARIINSEDAYERPRVVRQLLKLHRLKRDHQIRDSLNGPLGAYNRAVTCAEFSSDGSIFAVADLCGYVDTWVTEGHTDPTAPEADVDESPSSASSSDDDDESDDEQEPAKVTILGQRWIRNPSGHLLPRLDSTPLVLSFQPRARDSGRPEPNGNPAVHPTRHNPHPHSHDIPNTEQHLLVVSEGHRLYHFDILAGRLSDWSRRNPPSSYPPQFRLLDDPVKGCTWDVSGENCRLWLHGEKWLFMFDLSKDFPLSGSTEASQLTNGAGDEGVVALKKRKREPIQEVSRRNNSGAGDAVPEKEAPVTKMRKFNSGKSDESSKTTWIGTHNTREAADEDSEDIHQALASARGSRKDVAASATEHTVLNGDYFPDDSEPGSREEKKRSNEPWWHTFKYRPILGVVPVGGGSQPLEVVLVERPSWDLDLPPRFVGSHE